VLILRLLEIVVVAILMIGFSSQIVIPAIRGTAWFPLMRSDRRHAEADYRAAREAVDIAATRKDIGRLQDTPVAEEVIQDDRHE
jgi:hypothetical protein